MGEEIALSLEETNKLRVSIGLKPIPLPEATTEHSKHQSQKRANSPIRHLAPPPKRSKVGQDAVKKVELLHVQPLDGDDLSTLDFLSQLDQATANGREEETVLPDTDEEDIHSEVALSHNATDLDAMGTDKVLTLGDASIFDGGSEDEGDVLINENMVRHQKTRAHEEEKRKIAERHHRKFGGFADDEDSEDTQTSDATVGIRLISGEIKNVPQPKEDVKLTLKEIFEDEVDLSQSQQQDTRKSFKKIKKKDKKAKKKTERLANLFDDDDDGLHNQKIQEVQLETFEDAETEEGEDFSNLMSLQRRRKQKLARGALNSEDIAREIKQIKRREEAEEEIPGVLEGGIMYDDNSEFLNSLSSNLLPDDTASETPENNTLVTKEEAPPQEADNSHSVNLNEVEKEVDSTMREISASGSSTAATNDMEETIGNGLGGALKLLRQRNILQAKDEQQAQAERAQSVARRRAELVRFQISVEERILEEELSKDKAYRKLSKEEKEKQYGKFLDQRLQAKNLTIGTSELSNTNFSPEVKLQYRDDDGKELDTKGAFKHLSHKFHGTKKR